MSVAGDAVPVDGGQDDGGGQNNEPPEIEGDVPKPAFEEPEPKPAAPAADAKGGDRAPRRERMEKYQEWKGQALRYEQELREMRDRVARMEGERQAERARAEPAADPIKALDDRIDSALERMGKGDQYAVDEWKRLMTEKQRIIARTEAEALVAKNAPKPIDPVIAAVTARYPWIATDEEARRVAEGHVARLVRREKRDMSDPAVRRQTLLQAAAEAARDLEIGDLEPHEPSEVQRERYRGVSGQSTGGARGTGKTMVALNADQKAQAEALFKHMEPEQAHKEWWMKVGKKIAEQSK